MITAIVLLKVEKDRVHPIAEDLAGVKGVTEVFSVAGEYDVVAIVRHKDNESLESIITNYVLKVKGILTSETLIAFQAFSPSSLEAVFGDFY